jgi:hypothetical protein
MENRINDVECLKADRRYHRVEERFESHVHLTEKASCDYWRSLSDLKCRLLIPMSLKVSSIIVRYIEE